MHEAGVSSALPCLGQCQACWQCWLSRMSSANFIRTMSRKTFSPDNAESEGSFRRLRNELGASRPRPWSPSSRRSIPLPAGATKNGPRSSLAHSAPSSTRWTSGSPHKPVQVLIRPSQQVNALLRHRSAGGCIDHLRGMRNRFPAKATPKRGSLIDRVANMSRSCHTTQHQLRRLRVPTTLSQKSPPKRASGFAY